MYDLVIHHHQVNMKVYYNHLKNMKVYDWYPLDITTNNTGNTGEPEIL